MQPSRRAVSLVEVLCAVLVLSLLVVAYYGTIVSSVRGISTDRLTEAKRSVTQDLLERFCHPYSDIQALIPAGASDVTLPVEEGLRLIGLPAESTPRVTRVLKEGGVLGFTLVLARVKKGPGTGPRVLRLNTLWCIPQLRSPPSTPAESGPRVDAVRSWWDRGTM